MDNDNNALNIVDLSTLEEERLSCDDENDKQEEDYESFSNHNS